MKEPVMIDGTLYTGDAKSVVLGLPPSELAPFEPQAQSARCALAICSLPVSSAEAFYRELLEKIADWPRNDRGRRMAQSGLTFWDEMKREMHRRQMGLPIQRQPEENAEVTRPSERTRSEATGL